MAPLVRVCLAEHVDILFAFFWAIFDFICNFKVYSIFKLYLKWGTLEFVARRTRSSVPRPLPSGPLSQRDPTVQVWTRERARARGRGTPATMAGDVVRTRVRGRTRSTRNYMAKHLRTAPPSNGHRSIGYLAGNNGGGGGSYGTWPIRRTSELERGESGR